MPETHSPPALAQVFLLIHKVISHGLIVSVAKGADFIQVGFPDPGMRTGYALYVQSLAAVLDAHHLGEDEIAFPAFREKIPAAPYDRLAKHHQEIVSLLDLVGNTISPVEERGEAADLAALVEGLRKISDIWRPHIQTEEWYFSEDALAAVMSPEEQNRVSAAMGKHNQEHATPDYLALPFVLFNLDTEDRAAMAATMPKMIVEELIPKAWKGQWAPMKPFLLE
jgi:hypothetical protein